MIVFLQFTLTDTRSLSSKSSELLTKPTWPTPTPNTHFVRGMGSIIPRRKKGLRSWVGENYLCHIRRGINTTCNSDTSSYKLRNVFNNFYAGTDMIMNRYEFVFKVDFKDKSITQDNIKEVINHIMISKVSIRVNGTIIDTIFSRIQNDLLSFHRENTTLRSALYKNISTSEILKSTPQFYFMLDENERICHKHFCMEEFSPNGKSFSLYSDWYKVKNISIKIWIHDRRKHADYLEQRALRISLQRIFSEYECLKNVFQSIKSFKIDVNEGSGQSEVLQRYFNSAIRSFLDEKKSLERENNITQFSDQFSNWFDNFQPGDLQSLKNQIKSFAFRPNIEKKTINILNNISSMDTNYTFNNSQIGAVGDNAKADNSSFQQNHNTVLTDIDRKALKNELASLFKALSSEATTAEENQSVKCIAIAQEAVTEKNDSKLFNYLKASGSWALDTATKIGVSVVSELMKQQMGQG